MYCVHKIPAMKSKKNRENIFLHTLYISTCVCNVWLSEVKTKRKSKFIGIF
jgi:hypothetical protein